MECSQTSTAVAAHVQGLIVSQNMILLADNTFNKKNRGLKSFPTNQKTGKEKKMQSIHQIGENYEPVWKPNSALNFCSHFWYSFRA